MMKRMNLDNYYNPNMLNRSTTPGYGCSHSYEDEIIKEFGTISTFIN